MYLTFTLPASITLDQESERKDKVDEYFMDDKVKAEVKTKGYCSSKRNQDTVVFSLQFHNFTDSMEAYWLTKKDDKFTVKFLRPDDQITEPLETKITKVEKPQEEIKTEVKKTQVKPESNENISKKKGFPSLLFVIPDKMSFERAKEKLETYFNQFKQKPLSVTLSTNSTQLFVNYENVEQSGSVYLQAKDRGDCPIPLIPPTKEKEEKKGHSSLMFVVPNEMGFEVAKEKLGTYLKTFKKKPTGITWNPSKTTLIYANFESQEDTHYVYKKTKKEGNCPLVVKAPYVDKEKPEKFVPKTPEKFVPKTPEKLKENKSRNHQKGFSVGPYDPNIIKTIQETLQTTIEKKYSVKCTFSVKMITFSGENSNCLQAQKNFETDFLCHSLELQDHALGCNTLLNMVYKVNFLPIFKSIGNDEFQALHEKIMILKNVSKFNRIVDSFENQFSKIFLGTCRFFTRVKSLISQAKESATELKGIIWSDSEEISESETDEIEDITIDEVTTDVKKYKALVIIKWAKVWFKEILQKANALQKEHKDLDIKVKDKIPNEKDCVKILIFSSDKDLANKIKKEFVPKNFFLSKNVNSQKFKQTKLDGKLKYHAIHNKGLVTIYTLNQSILDHFDHEIVEKNFKTEKTYKVKTHESFVYFSLMIKNIENTSFIKTVEYEAFKDCIKLKGLSNDVFKAIKYFNEVDSQIQSKKVTFNTDSERRGFLFSQFYTQVMPTHPSIVIVLNRPPKQEKEIRTSLLSKPKVKTEKKFEIDLTFIGIQMLEIDNAERTIRNLISGCVSQKVMIPRDCKNLTKLVKKMEEEYQISCYLPKPLEGQQNVNFMILSSFDKSELESSISDLSDSFIGESRDIISIEVKNWLVYDKLKPIINEINSKKLAFCSFQKKSFNILLKGKKVLIAKASDMITLAQKNAQEQIKSETVSFADHFCFLLRNEYRSVISEMEKKNSTLIQFSESSSQCCSLKIGNSFINLYFGDITTARCDFIVSSANSGLGNEGGVAHHIIKKAGKSVQDECDIFIKKNNALALTETLVTSGGNLKCKIIHVVPPVYSGSEKECANNLKRSVVNTLLKATSEGAKSVALPALSCGIFGYPVSEGLTIITETAREFLTNHDINVSFYCNDSDMTQKWFEILVSKFNAKSKTVDLQITNSLTFLPDVKQSSQWFFVDADAQWCQYDKSNNLKLQHGFETKNWKLMIKINGVEYDVDLKNMTQTRKDKNTVRTISNQAPKESVPNWQWKENDGTWYSYGQEKAKTLEKAYNDNKLGSVELKIQRIITDVPQTYTCDFKTMIQTSKDNAKRQIKRLEPDVNPMQTRIVTEEKELDLKHIKILGYSKSSVDKTILELKTFEKTLIIEKLVLGASMTHVDQNASFFEKVLFKEVEKGLQVSGYIDMVEQAANSIREIFFDSSMTLLNSVYPSNWTGSGDFNLVQLDPSTREFLRVQTDFNLTSTQKVKRIERIENKHLYALFSSHKKLQNISISKNLWHGTRSTPPNAIYNSKTGFDTRYSSGGMWGKGSYFAVNSSYSAKTYHYSVPQTTEKQLFYCSVLVGDSITLAYDQATTTILTMPPLKPNGKFKNETYESVNGNTNGSDVYIIYENHMAYPEYLLTFE